MKKESFIDIDFAPKRNLIWSGLFLKENRQVFILIDFDLKTKRLNGVSVFRNKDIFRWRNWDRQEKKELKVDNRQEFISKIDLDKMNTFYSCLKQIDKNELVSFFTDHRDDQYEVGQIIKLTRQAVSLRLVSVKGEYSRRKKLKLSDIDYFCYLGKYESKLKKQLSRKASL